MEPHKNRKAQLSSADFALAISIAIIILLSVISAFIYYENKINEAISYNDLLTKNFQISDALVKMQGIPSNWESSNVYVIGLAFEDRKISRKKLDQFVNMDERDIKSIMKTNYEFHFNIRYINGTSIKSAGTNLSESRTRSVTIERYVFYENKTAIIEFKLWE